VDRPAQEGALKQRLRLVRKLAIFPDMLIVALSAAFLFSVTGLLLARPLLRRAR
jgi:hypothetical protein